MEAVMEAPYHVTLLLVFFKAHQPRYIALLGMRVEVDNFLMQEQLSQL